MSQLRFLEVLAHLHSQAPSPLNEPCFCFERNLEAAIHNASILEEYNFDLNRIIITKHPSPISYGSEFKTSSELEEILQDHPHWPFLKEILDKGATFPLHPISQQDRIMDLNFHWDRGNHIYIKI